LNITKMKDPLPTLLLLVCLLLIMCMKAEEPTQEPAQNATPEATEDGETATTSADQSNSASTTYSPETSLIDALKGDVHQLCDDYWAWSNQYAPDQLNPVLRNNLRIMSPVFESGNMSNQFMSHLYCANISNDFAQCLIYSSFESDAELRGIKYIISETLFNTLPEEEKKYWHSNMYAMHNGITSFPDLTLEEEKVIMDRAMHSYGKSIYTWGNTDLPLGPPMVMMAPIADDQADMEMVNAADDEAGGTTVEERKEARKDVEMPEKALGADAWAITGQAVQFINNLIPMKGT
jgi:hypothetical protein